MPGHAELHCHTEFSFLDGASSADELVERAAQLGFGALAITDHQGLYGAVRFVTAAGAARIHPVVGVEIELLDAAVADPHGIVVPSHRRRRGGRPARAAWEAWSAGADETGRSEAEAGRATHDLRGVPDGPRDEERARRRPQSEPDTGGRGEAPESPTSAPTDRIHAGLPVRPRSERLRLPGHREPVREDLRGIGDAQRGPHLVLLARDQSGYRSLSRLVSAANLAGSKGVPRFTHELLERHVEGVVALSGCRHGEVARRLLAGDREGAARAAERYARMLGTGRHIRPAARGADPIASAGLVLELQHHLLPDDDWLVAETVRLAAELGLPVVVTNDVHYALPGDRELQDVMVSIRHGLTLDESARLRRPNGEYHLKSADELRTLPPGDRDADPVVRHAWEEGIANAAGLASACRVDLGFERYRFPGFEVPKGETPFSHLEALCHEGARRRYHPLTPRVLTQLAHELDVIERTGLAEFFLICWDLMRFARERSIPAQGRGSAGDSIVAYVLGITRVDPIRHNLLFERFINEGRTSYPDVDIDFASSRREEVIRYVYQRYGAEHTGMVCNVVTYRARSAVREVGYALGFPRPLVDRVAKALETYDSVMVRRDLEADGGFGEFFAVPGEPVGEGTTKGGARVHAERGAVRAPGGGVPGGPAAGVSGPASPRSGLGPGALRPSRPAPRHPPPGALDARASPPLTEEIGTARPGREADTSPLGEEGAGSEALPGREADISPLPDEQRAGTRAPADPRVATTRRSIPALVSPDPVRALAAATGFVDEMGQLNHARGGRWRPDIRGATGAGPGPDEHGDGRQVRCEDVGRAEVAGDPPGWHGRILPGDAASPWARQRGRRVASDEEGGPGDTPVSIAWLRAEREHPPARTPEVARDGRGRGAAGGSSTDAHLGGTDAPGTIGGRRIDPESGVLLPADRPIDLAERVSDSGTAFGPSAAEEQTADPGLDSNPGMATPFSSASAGVARALRPGRGVTGGWSRPGASREGAPPPGRTPPSSPLGARAAPRGAWTRAPRSSVARIEPDPPPERRPGSTAGLSPWERWLELCARIDGRPRHLGIHVGGMLVTAAPLVEIAPLERATMPGRVVVQYDKRDVETMKLIKLDLLGLRMLSAMDDALRDITADCGVVLDLDRLPEDLPDVFRMIRAADTTGVFQIESRAQMQTLPKSNPTTLDDLVVEVAIIRPGPIQGNAVHPYLRRRQKLEPVSYLHPSLEPVLRETLGVILYQEQVMEIAIQVAGFSAAESDGFRRAMGTWRSSREMEKLHRAFVEGCERVSGLIDEQAEELFRQVSAFASFGFNKSHAAAFARTAYESAFLKLYYPAHFTVGLINNQPMGFYPVEVLINDAKRHGVPVLPVDLNRSRYRTTTEWVGMPGTALPEGCGIERRPRAVRSSGCVVPDPRTRRQLAAESAIGYAVRLGLHLVKGIGEEHAEQLDAELERGPYRSLADVVARTGLTEELIERLVRSGALDSLGRPRRELLWQLREVAASTERTGGAHVRAGGAEPHARRGGVPGGPVPGDARPASARSDLRSGSLRPSGPSPGHPPPEPPGAVATPPLAEEMGEALSGGETDTAAAAVPRPNRALPIVLHLRLPPTDAPDLPPPTELERLADSYAILSLDARCHVVELFRPALDRLGGVRNARLADLRPGPIRLGGLVVTRQHPMTARGTVFLALEDETGMVNVTLWPDTWARFRGVVRRHALLWVEGELQREASVVNVVARIVRPLPEIARSAGGPAAPPGIRAQGHAGMRRG